MASIKFTGILPALVTPFCADNRSINRKVTKEILDYQMAQGANGFYILGGTGEGYAMARPEREEMCELVVSHVKGRVPVICHIAASNLPEACELARHAERVGADAIAAIPPLFFFYDADDIYHYYRRLAESVHIPVIVYYHPSAQRDISADLMARIYTIDNVTGVKWSSNNFFELMKLRDKTHGEMNVINGPDELLVNGLMAGADAGIGSTYNVMLPEFLDIYRLFREGKLDEARKAQYKVNRVIDRLIKGPVIPGVKSACRALGFDVGQATYPMRQYTAEMDAELKNDLVALGWPFGRSLAK